MNKKNLIIIISIIIIIAIVIAVVFFSKNKETSTTNSTIPASLKSSLTISDVISKFKTEGIQINLEENKPIFSMIGAKDGEMFYLDNDPVKLYIFESEKKYKEALSEYPILGNMPKKDLVVIDTNSSKALEIFDSL